MAGSHEVRGSIPLSSTTRILTLARGLHWDPETGPYLLFIERDHYGLADLALSYRLTHSATGL